MAYLWIVTLGILICLTIIGGVFFVLIKLSLDTDDSSRIDSPKQIE
ncbi:MULTISPECIES: hypothetical protein [unclassified Bacillus (in: firmicutes)]|nr:MULTISPECIES: hypothetical protein [unclassified Bacillus (in: firmicutes)]